MAQAANPNPNLKSPSMLDLPEIVLPKKVDPREFMPLLARWLSGFRSSRNVTDMERREFTKVRHELMKHLPIQKEGLLDLPFLLPERSREFMPPTMRFGWLVSIDKIKQLGLARGKYLEDVLVDEYAGDDPKLPPNATFNPDTYFYEVEKGTEFSPERTTYQLLELGKTECGLAEKYPGRLCQYFAAGNIWFDFDEVYLNTQFISIYTNLDLLPPHERRDSKFQIPSQEDIKKMQEWLGLGDPGWWFALTGISRPRVWYEYDSGRECIV